MNKYQQFGSHTRIMINMFKVNDWLDHEFHFELAMQLTTSITLHINHHVASLLSSSINHASNYPPSTLCSTTYMDRPTLNTIHPTCHAKQP
jgi:hypothetical protein